jgi:hypothetical protein
MIMILLHIIITLGVEIFLFGNHAQLSLETGVVIPASVDDGRRSNTWKGITLLRCVALCQTSLTVRSNALSWRILCQDLFV